jgi:peptide-methionine (S)-S-oxide reductase
MNTFKLNLIVVIAMFSGCYEVQKSNETTDILNNEIQNSKLKTAYFASGCFWCVEAIFESVKGVDEVVSGYAGGSEKNPTYNQVAAGRTSHAEAVKVFYDPNKVSFLQLLDVYYGSHDPTALNYQGPDYGSQYRSIAFYQNETEKSLIDEYIKALEASGVYKKPIVTEVLPFTIFYEAEEYHQDFERKNPNNRYILNVSVPRLKRFQRLFPELLKENNQDH